MKRGARAYRAIEKARVRQKRTAPGDGRRATVTMKKSVWDEPPSESETPVREPKKPEVSETALVAEKVGAYGWTHSHGSPEGFGLACSACGTSVVVPATA